MYFSFDPVLAFQAKRDLIIQLSIIKPGGCLGISIIVTKLRLLYANGD